MIPFLTSPFVSTLFGPEEGHFALALACILAFCQAVMPLAGLRLRHNTLINMATPLAFCQALALLLSFLCLVLAALRDDFSVQNIAANSALQKPLLYKITGIWGNHEGSILLWCVILGLCGVAVACSSPMRHKTGSTVKSPVLPVGLKTRILAVLGGVAAGFELFCLLTSNPFTRLYPMPADGQGMNPLLQDPGLAFHPPVLYAGYVGFAVPFAFAVAALMEGQVDAQWGRRVRFWVVAAWALLTCGITLGSWWSYYVLGWGGYWFWDPVENASLIPWLSGTALLHCAIVVEKREGLKIWTILLALATFSFSLSGTFLVRSGILNSVHAFANDPARGVFILSLLGLITGGSLALFAWRAPSLTSQTLFAPLSREGALVINNILLSALCAVVLTGTMYPPFMQLLFGRTLSVGKPFFDSVTIPLAMPLLAVMGFGTSLSWKRASSGPVLHRLRPAMSLALAGFVAGLYFLHSLIPALCAGLAIWVISASLCDFIIRLRSVPAISRLPRSLWGACLAHIGVGVTVLGLCGMSAARQDIVEAQIGQSFHLSYNTDWTLQGVTAIHGPNYEAQRASILVTENSHVLAILHPEQRYFPRQNQTTGFVAIHSGPWRDLYAVLGKSETQGHYILRLHNNPLAIWIWAGGFIMAFGGFLSLTDRHFRFGAPTRYVRKA